MEHLNNPKEQIHIDKTVKKVVVMEEELYSEKKLFRKYNATEFGQK